MHAENIKQWFDLLADASSKAFDAKDLSLSDLPVINMPNDPDILFWQHRRRLFKELREENILPAQQVFARYQLLMKHL